MEKNEIASETECLSLAKSLEEKHLTPFFENISPETKIEDFDNAIDTVVKTYDETAIGPAKERIYQEFMKVQNIILMEMENEITH